MKKSTLVWLIIGISLLLIGVVIFSSAMSIMKWNFFDLQNKNYETKEYEISETYNSIYIVSELADVVLEPSANNETKVICYQQTNLTYSVKVQNNTLLIDSIDTRKWFDHIGINFKGPKITVCIPEGEYDSLVINGDTGYVNIPEEFNFNDIKITLSTGSITNRASAQNDIKLKTSTGSISLINVFANNVSVDVSTGKVKLTNVYCTNISSFGNTGDVMLNTTVAKEKITIIRSTGDIEFETSDASELLIETDTGDISGTLSSDKHFIAQTNTGKIDVPQSYSSEKCQLKTNTGDIKISIMHAPGE